MPRNMDLDKNKAYGLYLYNNKYYFSLHPTFYNNITNSFDLNQGYDIKVLTPGVQNTHNANITICDSYTTIHKYLQTIASLNESFYATNIVTTCYKITIPPNGSLLIYGISEFLLVHKPNSVKNLFSLTHH